MSAFNWIELEAKCPACGGFGVLRAQTHIAPSYAGDDTGRFHDRIYRLRERMPWFSVADVRHASWSERADPGHRPRIREACYGTCSVCLEELCVVLEFDDIRAIAVVSVSALDEWPRAYSR